MLINLAELNSKWWSRNEMLWKKAAMDLGASSKDI